MCDDDTEKCALHPIGVCRLTVVKWALCIVGEPWMLSVGSEARSQLRHSAKNVVEAIVCVSSPIGVFIRA